jgi:hypothetical protein
MLNTNNFESLIKPVQNKNNKKYFQDLLSKNQINFNDINNFPKEKGLYFLYYQKILLYIGSASASSRTIQIRCRQYLQRGSGGESFRGKIEKLRSITAVKAIEFVQNNISAKFITFDNLEVEHIKQLEQIAICCYQPPLNFILKKFDYKNLQIEKLTK